MSASRPIEIVGGGLAGLALGLALRRDGVGTTVIEAMAYPRHRVCGEFIAGLAGSTIRRLGLAPFLGDAVPHRSVAWFAGGRSVRRQRLPSPALGLSRYALDARLAAAFVEAGGMLETGRRLQDTDDRPGRVFACGRKPIPRSPWIGLKLHAFATGAVRDLEVHLGNGAYVGLSAVEGGAVNACGLFRRRAVAGSGSALFRAYLEACGLAALARRIGTASIDETSFCAVAALNFRGSGEADGRLRIGDARAAIAPFTGNGMAMAFQGAECALDPLLAYARGKSGWAEAKREADRALRRRFGVRLASAAALHPFLLEPRRQRWLAALGAARLLPMRPLYALLH